MSKLIVPVRTQDHRLGPANAPVTLVEYGDFECPYCGQAHTMLQDILDEMRSDLLFVFRYFPMTQVHPHAETAALAAEAAGVQGRFWEMHDALFENQRALSDEDLLRYAEALDLDLGRFEEDMRTRRHFPRLREDFMSGVRSGVNGTPTFFINGARHDGSYEYPVLIRALREAAATTKAH
jgi:protein-disulfide isomerase